MEITLSMWKCYDSMRTSLRGGGGWEREVRCGKAVASAVMYSGQVRRIWETERGL